MGNIFVGNNSEPMVSKKLQHSKWNKDHVQEDFGPAIDSKNNDGDNFEFDEEVKNYLERIS